MIALARPPLAELKANGLKMFGEAILVRPHPLKPEGDFELPGDYQDLQLTGEVMMVGPGLDGEPLPVKEGDFILHSPYAGSEILMDGERYFLMKYSIDILAHYSVHPDQLSDDKNWLKPVKGKVFLEWEEAQGLFADDLKGLGLIRPQDQQEKHYTGNVLNIGDEVFEVKPGMRVFFNQFCSPEKMMRFGKRYAIVNECDIFMEIPARNKVNLEAVA